MKISSAILKLLRAYSWTDEANLPALHRDANASKSEFNIHPLSSYQATCRKHNSKGIIYAIC